MTIISNEWKFYKKLPSKARLLIVSSALRSFANPLLSIFVNAFIWRSTASLANIAAYNLGYFIFLPLGFFVNGLALKRIKIAKLHLAGLIISAVSVAAVIFFPVDNFRNFAVYGLVYGFSSALFWANRNFLNFQETKSRQRNYFFSLNSALHALIALGVTFLAGWFIVLGQDYGLYTPTTAYWIFSALALLALVSSGLIVLKADYESPRVKKIIRFHISRRWNRIRLFNLGTGLLDGIGYFLPTMLILLYLGKEGVLGTINAIVSLFAIIVVYLYGRWSKRNHRRPVFFFTLSVYIMLSLFLLFLDPPFNVLVFVLFTGVAKTFLELTTEAVLLDAMDEEGGWKPGRKYSLVFDKEVFLNIGRITGVVILFLLVRTVSQPKALLLAPLVIAVVQMILMRSVWPKNFLKNND